MPTARRQFQRSIDFGLSSRCRHIAAKSSFTASSFAGIARPLVARGGQRTPRAATLPVPRPPHKTRQLVPTFAIE